MKTFVLLMASIGWFCGITIASCIWHLKSYGMSVQWVFVIIGVISLAGAIGWTKDYFLRSGSKE